MLRISDVMTRDVFTLAASTPAETAAWELIVRGFTGAPVRDARGRLVGVLSRTLGGDRGEMVGILTSSDILSQVAGVDVDLSLSIDGGCAPAGARRRAPSRVSPPYERGDWS